MTRLLNSGWILTCPGKGIEVPFSVPGDVHSALYAAGVIEDPYFRDNELAVDWVNRCEWIVTRDFEVTADQLELGNCLSLDQVDCVADIIINEQLVRSVESQFVHHHLDVQSYLKVGSNTLKIQFYSAVEEGARRAADFPFELPHSTNCRLEHSNLLRKTPCHAGWDWNICLMPTGVYGNIELRQFETHRVEDFKIEQHFDGPDATVQVSVKVHALEPVTCKCNITLGDETETVDQLLVRGEQELLLQISVSNPELWWPVGNGEQTRYLLSIDIGGQYQEQLIGLRKSQIVTTPDESGSGFRIDINDRPVFMRGANWIPADALPARGTYEVTRELLQSAVDANMNMLRVWGGGQYEASWFYELCDELGIMIWQDFMFSCNHYPAADARWLNLVRLEARQQVRRLSKYASVVLWCGDNEIVGALKWWDITRNNRDRYLANYVRLNHALEEVVEAELPSTDFWPSSPSVGKLDYGDGWKNDAAGDMHFWDVWHEAKPFSAYQDIHPRFCSEFGFQSFPSMPVVETFTLPEDRNVSSKVMGVHQRNVGGNARIVETLVRYFEFPDSFERMIFLSQCQQAMAIRTAVEYWRLLQPHCMGALFWQLNDTWPVASWASLEYGGGWKLLQYAARRFFSPLMVAMVPGHSRFSTEGQLWLKVVNDLTVSQELLVKLRVVSVEGEIRQQQEFNVTANANSVTPITEFSSDDLPDDCFTIWEWFDADQNLLGENEYWRAPYKEYRLAKPEIRVQHVLDDDEPAIELSTDKPAFFVTVNLGGSTVYSDNGFTLLPGLPKRLSVSRVLENNRIPQLAGVTIQHL